MIDTARKFQDIAIIGVGTIFSGSPFPAAFWQNIVTGADLFTEIPSTHWLINDYYDADPTAIDKVYVKRGSFIPDIDFDPLEFGIPPSNMTAIDTAQLLALVAAKQTLADALALDFKQHAGRVSIILGSSALQALTYASHRLERPVWQKTLREAGLPETQVQQICDSIANTYNPAQENTFPGLLSNVVAGRIANRFNLNATNCTVDAACAGSFAALSMAINELQLHTADMVITGGVDTLNDITMYRCFNMVKALSFTGDCRPFSQQADGTMLGEGIGMFALKRLVDAEANNDKIYAVIKGLGTSSDGRSTSIYAPLADGQARAITQAYELADFQPESIGLIEAHGTATRAGDAAEFAGLKRAFENEMNKDKGYCALGSIKSQIGHTKSAAGAAGLFKAVMALHHKILPLTLKVTAPNSALGMEDSPFYINTETRPWINSTATPRRAGVSAFGFGGSNYHVALEEYQGEHQAQRFSGIIQHNLFVLAAETPGELLKKCEVQLQDDRLLRSQARSSQTNFVASDSARLAVVAKTREELQQKLKTAIELIKKTPAGKFVSQNEITYGYGLDSGRVAFLFPGQGSQYVNMGMSVAMAFPQALAKWDACAERAQPLLHSLSRIVFPNPVFEKSARDKNQAVLTQTEWTQPALGVTSLMYLQLLRDLGVLPDAVVGHSFGELTALHAAGVLDESLFLQLAVKRGELLGVAAATTPGGMLSVNHNATELIGKLNQAGLTITAANFNTPTQLVLSGSLEEIATTEKWLTEQKISYLKLPVATCFHTNLLQVCQTQFAQVLKGLNYQQPNVKVYSNVTAEPYPNDPNKVAELLADQLVSPVLFQQQIESLYEDGVRTFIEVGPSAVLSGIVRQCLAGKEFVAVPLDSKQESNLASFWRGIGQLFVLGLNPAFATLWSVYRQETDVPISPTHAIKINGSLYGKQYPPKEGEKELPLPNLEKAPTTQPGNIIPATASQNQKRGMMMKQFNAETLHLYQDLQKQLVDAHNAYQRTMAETHVTFLNCYSQMMQSMMGGENNYTHPLQGATTLQSPTVSKAAPAAMNTAPPKPIPAPVKMAVTPTVSPVMQRVIQPESNVNINTEPQVTREVAKSVDSRPVVTNEKSTMLDMVLNIVVDKTGYPREMLNLDMAIEADLGIDSIKRVEILSAVADQIPDLPQVEPSQIGEFQTLRHIVDFIEKHSKEMAA